MSVGSLERFETARMKGERLRPEHAGELGALLRDPRVAATLTPHEVPPSEARVAEITTRQAGAWERHGFGMWLLRDRTSGALVGRGGLQHTRVTGAEEVEVGWAIVPERWGEGLATELGAASLELAFADLGLASVIAYALATNAASRRVMDKAGLIYERELEHVGLPHVLYRKSALG